MVSNTQTTIINRQGTKDETKTYSMLNKSFESDHSLKSSHNTDGDVTPIKTNPKY